MPRIIQVSKHWIATTWAKSSRDGGKTAGHKMLRSTKKPHLQQVRPYYRNVWSLSQPVYTLHQFIIPVNTPDCQDQEKRDHKGEYGG